MNTRDERRQAAAELRDLQEEYDNAVANIRTIAEQLKDKHALVYVVEHMESMSTSCNRFESSLESWIAELEDPEQDEEEPEPDDDGCDFDHPERLIKRRGE
jgi:chromosome segregation ATPase